MLSCALWQFCGIVFRFAVGSNNPDLICIDPEGSACIAEDELGIQLEEWEGSDDRQEPPSISAVEDSLLFESKTTFASVLCCHSGVAPFLSCKP